MIAGAWSPVRAVSGSFYGKENGPATAPRAFFVKVLLSHSECMGPARLVILMAKRESIACREKQVFACTLSTNACCSWRRVWSGCWITLFSHRVSTKFRHLCVHVLLCTEFPADSVQLFVFFLGDPMSGSGCHCVVCSSATQMRCRQLRAEALPSAAARVRKVAVKECQVSPIHRRTRTVIRGPVTPRKLSRAAVSVSDGWRRETGHDTKRENTSNVQGLHQGDPTAHHDGLGRGIADFLVHSPLSPSPSLSPLT